MSAGCRLAILSNKLHIFVVTNQNFIIMAKGNLFLGMGRGSIGDVTFYRADGKQLSRVRNRNPKNPKTQAQIYQRAIMATIVKAYQAGKAIFDHSFEGYSVGAQCQRQFMSLNAKFLRQRVATDVNTPAPHDMQFGRVVAPGVSVPVPNAYIISRGSYQQSAFSFNDSVIGYYLPQNEQGEKVSEYAARVGLIPGDIYTFVVFAIKEDMAYVSTIYDDALAMQNYCKFGWVRLIVRSDILTDEEEATDYSSLFNFESSGGDFDHHMSDIDTKVVDAVIKIEDLISQYATGYTGSGAIGLIRSRRDQDLRSDSEMRVNYGSDAEDMFGISSDYLLDEWTAGTVKVGDSELILEGGNV